MFELDWNLEIFLESSLLSLIVIPMDLFDRLVIVIYDPFMEG